MCLVVQKQIPKPTAYGLLLVLFCVVSLPTGQAGTNPTPDGVFSVRDFGAAGDSQTDDTAAIQKAIDAAAVQGGQVYLPPARYLVRGSLKVKTGVAVTGAQEAPLAIEPLIGTAILATGGRDDESAPALFEMGHSSTVKGLTVWYPEQKPDDIRPYP
ncbi:MAG TPA: glycosyl hydrolase family 28-related protein, partial [bacterium]|nr:glycosyl hydrolase family 28-related protein [bacterium]